MAIENITLNLIPTGDTPSIHVAQFDVDRPFNVTLKEGEDDFTPTGYTIELQVRKVDNNIVTAVPVQTSDNVVTFNTTQQMTACSGTNLAELQLTKDSQTFATLHFYLVVQRDVLAGGFTSESDIYNLTEQIAAIVPEVIGDDYYNKEEVDEKIAEIPTFDPTNYYDKSETDALLDDKADVSDLPDMSNYYDKSETDALLDDKADVSDLPDMSNYYTKSEVDTKITDLYQIKTVSGSIAHFTDGGNNIPVKSLVSQIVAVESGSGEKSPTNPYTISGFDSGVVSVCGKNLLNVSAYSDLSIVGAYAIQRNVLVKSVRATMCFSDKNTSVDVTGCYIGFIDNAYSGGSLSGSMYRWIMSNGTIQNVKQNYSNDDTSNFLGGIFIYPNNEATYNKIFSRWNISVVLGTSELPFEAYNGNTYTFTFGQTVYGGYFDNKGNLVVTKAVVDLGSLSWTYHAPSGDIGAFFDTYLPSNSIVGNRDVAFDGNIGIYNIIPSKDIALSGYDNNVCALANATRRFITCDQRYSDAASYTTAMSGVMLVYPLANPITLAITSQDIPTLLGENNIFSNCGDVEVNYFTSKSDGIAELIKAFM